MVGRVSAAPRLAQRVTATRQALAPGQQREGDSAATRATTRRRCGVSCPRLGTRDCRLGDQGANAYGHAEPFVPVDSKLAGVPGAAHLEARAPRL
ncbi:hypothetical protein HPB50_010658 [Hyalomma asiaticum]|uniref:Uncharacterized protein n=1 Tax=Hyalomma asiaticum TaxID=266040 RepID=A0ACB7TG32_HYAAI|nr:hypothetical protein HPB50_010658 [Hyalomma asiaticum]